MSHGIEPEIRQGRKLAPTDRAKGNEDRGRRLSPHTTASENEEAETEAQRKAVKRLLANHGGAGHADEAGDATDGTVEGRRPLGGPNGRVFVTEGNEEVRSIPATASL